MIINPYRPRVVSGSTHALPCTRSDVELKSTKYFTVFDVHMAVRCNIISIVKPTRCTNVSNLYYFGMTLLHVSDGLSVHHQEFKTVYTATRICQTDTAVCLLASRQHLVGFTIEIYFTMFCVFFSPPEFLLPTG